MGIMSKVTPQFLKNVFPGYFAKPPNRNTKNTYGLTLNPAEYGMDDPANNWYQDQVQLGQDRFSRYVEYEAMDSESTEIHTALDHYADDATQFDYDHHATVWVESESPQIKAILMELLHDRLEVEDYIWGLARSLAKYGDTFRRIVVDTQEYSRGIIHWIPEHPRRIVRVENPKTGQLKRFEYSAAATTNTGYNTKDSGGSSQTKFQPWDFVHFRILGDVDSKDFSLLYGQSMLQASRATWKRLKLLEEALSIYRLMMAPDRLIFYVDTGDMGPEESWEVIRRWKRMYNRYQFVNPGQGIFNQQTNPPAFDEKIFWPIAKDNASRIDRLPGGVDVTSIADLDYFRQKLAVGLKIPTEYMSGQAGAVFQFGAGSLAQKDIKYAKAIKRLQRALIQGLTRICEIHLSFLDIEPSEHRFTVRMGTISGSDEEQRLNNLSLKIGVGTSLSALLREIEVAPAVIKEHIVRKVIGLDGELANVFIYTETPVMPQEPPLGGTELPAETAKTQQQQGQGKGPAPEQQSAETPAQEGMNALLSGVPARDTITSLMESIYKTKSEGEQHARIYGGGSREARPNVSLLTQEDLAEVIEELREEAKSEAGIDSEWDEDNPNTAS